MKFARRAKCRDTILPKGHKDEAPRISAPLVLSTLALMVSLGGVGAAATGLINGSSIKPETITAKQIKNGTVTGSKLANGTVAGARIANATIGGSKIANGAITSAALAPGAAFPTSIPAGKTVTGTFFVLPGTGTPGQGIAISWLWSLKAFPTVVFRYSPYTAPSPCGGTAQQPTAPSGYLCIYVDYFGVGQTVMWAQLGTLTSGAFILPTLSGDASFDGSWAVTGN